MRSPVRFRVIDVVAFTVVAGVIASVVGAAGVSKQEVAGRIKCAANLRQIGMAIQLYANENRGAYPRTRADIKAPLTWGTPYSPDKKDIGPTIAADPFANNDDARSPAKPAALATRPDVNDMTAPLYLLIRTEDIVPEVFVCPSTTLKRFEFGGEGHGALEWTNFPGKEGVAKHLSYSYQNPYASAEAIMAGFKLNNSVTAEFAVMADMNPGGDALLKATIDDAAVTDANVDVTPAQKKFNSLNHGGDGQNVLFGDGHVEFLNNPFVGVNRDNIYVSGDAAKDRKDPKPAIAASPVDANDSILLPTAADVGQVVTMRDSLPPQDPTALLAKVRGAYHVDLPGRTINLTVGDKTLKIKAGPTTTDLNFDVVGAADDVLSVLVSGEEVPPFSVTFQPHAGGLKIEGAGPLTADWKTGPSTRPASMPTTRGMR